MALQPFQDEQLNYFKFASIVLNEFPKALRQTFRSMWDNAFGHLPGFQPWDDSIVVRNLFLSGEGAGTKVPANLSYEEWDCTALFQATIFARSFALPDSKGHHKTLSDLYVKPHKLAHGRFHVSVVSPGGNKAETFALAIDQLRLLRNLLCHSTSSEIVKVTFDQYVQHAKDAFKALGVKTDPIDVIGGLTESDFPTKEVRKLEQAMKEETQAYIKFLEGMSSDIDELRVLLTAMKEGSASKEDIATLEQNINDLRDVLAQDKPDSKPSLPKSCLPPMVPHFTGRQKECEEITGHVTSGPTRIVSIWGSPGFGKTSVAIAVGHNLHSQGLPGYYLSLRGLHSTADLASKLLSLFRRPVASDQQNQQRISIDDELSHLLSEMSDPFTIILDNADELLSGGPNEKEDFTHFLEDILRRTEKVTFVITTRESLEFMNVQFQGHQAVRICPLDESSSQNLVHELLPKATTYDSKRVTQICGHVPLAMKLLCAAISEDDIEPSQSLNDFVMSLESNNIVEMLDNPDYPSNLRLKLLFDSSFQRLSAQEKEALVSLSVLPESFDLTVAAAVLGISQTPVAKKILHNFRRKSLLDSSSKPGSFVMHRIISSFANHWGENEMKETILKSKARLRQLLAQDKPGASTVVPPEILARGPLALEAYDKALSAGKTFDNRVAIMLIGQDRSGKTSLKNSLRGKPFNSDEDSTAGIEVDPSHFKVSAEIWKAEEKDQETNFETSISYEHHAARLIVERLRQIENISKERDPELMQNVSSDVVTTECSDDYDNSASSSSDVPDATTHDPTNDSRPSISSLPSFHVQTSSDPEPSSGSVSGMSDDIATLIEKLLGEVDKVEDKEDLYSELWDFAGQSVYYVTHPFFLTSRAIYLLVNDLSRNPHERAKSVMKQGMFSTSEDSVDFRTNLDYLDFWMSSIASLAIEDEGDQQSPKSEMLPDKLPPVFLVCTHADIPYDGGDPSKLAYKVFGSLQTKPYKPHLYDDVFVVDNTKSGKESECTEVVRLRKEVLDVAKELPQMKEAIPVKWLRYEKVLQDVKNDGHKCISLDSAKQVASEVCDIVDDKQFNTLLNFLHDQRIFIHFDDTPELNRLVVLDPQWLIDVFKGVINIRPYSGKEKKLKQLWCKLEMEGILDEKLLEHVWGPLFLPQETSDSLIAIMEKFSLLCPLPSSDVSCSKEYLVPSMLKSHPPEGIMELIKSVQLPSLFLKFESGLVPPGLFPRLVLQFFHRAKDECMSLEDPHLYHNFARFYSLEENYSVFLLCHSFSIEIVVHKGDSSHDLADGLQSKLSLSPDASFDTYVRAVRRQLGLILESMRKEFFWLRNMKYKVSFICPVCCKGSAVKNCSTHGAKKCEQEECLHFWSESQLCCVNTIFCKKSAVAPNERVQTEQFAPWLLPLKHRHTDDEKDGRNLASAEATEEIALRGEVLESLLSQSCDAKEVVLQMRENMQLEQASLEQPDSETKTLIRCLARKAKDSNRLDVFEHLREITPAGTTGPLLPEHFDVRNIPVSKARELTINLSGGDEWKVVAEALGLTPPEIRFLDNRTLNPFDSALAFIARQRCITVGELYDLLNEHGFPVIADLL